MKPLITSIVLSLSLSLSLSAMNCSSVKDIKEFNGHYYTVTIDKLTFEAAKQIAINNGGYLAIPNNAAENAFIKSLLGGGSSAWIGIHDPNKTSNYCYGGTSCSYDDGRFRDINNAPLIYRNWGSYQPDNLVKQYDIIDGKNMVHPLGEPWVAINANNGFWHDEGNHADEYNNPVKYKAVFEFDTIPDCMQKDDIETELHDSFCNTKIWDASADVVVPGETLECLEDTYGTKYCPEALAPAEEYWDYEDGYSVANIGSAVDYVQKISTTTVVNGSFEPSSGWFGWVCYYDGGQDGGCEYWGKFTNCKAKTCPTGTREATDAEYIEILGGAPDAVDASCSTGALLCGNATTTTTTTYTCPAGYTDNGTNCKKTVSYTYYNYLCSNETNAQNIGFVPTDSGGDKGSDATYSEAPPSNNCKRLGFTCNSDVREPAWVDNKWQCSPFPCLGEDNFENLDASVGASDSNNEGWNEDGSCSGELLLFSGKAQKCRNWDMLQGLMGGGCCKKDSVFLGLVACKANEKELAEKNKAELCHHVGEFCSKKLNLGFSKICVQKSKGHCCFNSRLSRILNEQGRPQIARGWGSADNPNCKGFTPEEFQKIDMSQMNLTEFTDSIQLPDTTAIGNSIKTKVQNHLNHI